MDRRTVLYYCQHAPPLTIVMHGVGHRPIRTVFWYLLMVEGFAGAYAQRVHIPALPDALIYSLTSFHGRGFFPGLGKDTTLHNPLVMRAAAEAVSGLFIEISFIATFTQRHLESKRIWTGLRR